jgi:hypothetical protein
VALDGTRARQRPQNRQWASAGGGGSPCSRGQSEREGKRVGQKAQIYRGEVGEQGAGLKRGAGAQMWLENTQSWACPRRGDRGRKVEDD